MAFTQLGYRAKDKFGNLWAYQWGEDDTFQILVDGVYKDADDTEYEVLNIYYKTN